MLGLSLLTGPARAANQTVTSLADSGAGSLRDAIGAVGIGETINFAVTGTIALTSGRLLITDHVTITGPGASSLTVNRLGGGAPFPVFEIAGGANVNISGLSITGGSSTMGGGGIALYSATLVLEHCAITDNQGFNGGGIGNNNGTLTIRHCLVARNTSKQNEQRERGGGVYNAGGTTVIENSTLFQNSALTGGAIAQSGGNLTVTHCTFSENHTFPFAPTDRANCILATGSAVVTLRNTILKTEAYTALNAPSAAIISSGYNLCNDAGGGFLTGPGDQINTNAKLDPLGLRDNGGPTPTIALLGDSSAVDRGKSFGLNTDQRGQSRPRDLSFVTNAAGGDGSDIGAFEASDFQPAGQNFTVTTTDDHDDGIAGLVDCTLREALRALNSSAGPGTITFASNVTGTIILDSQLGQLNVTNPVTLAGPGARKMALSGENGVRPIFSFVIGSSGSAISGLTVRNGQRLGASVDGAGLVNLATLTVSDCAFTSNSARGFAGSQPGQVGGTARGGAVFNGGALTLNRCTFNANAARGGNSLGSSVQFAFGPGGGAGLGAAVFNDTNATLAVDNCTFFNNNSTGGNGANNTGAGSRGGNGGPGFGCVFNQGTMTLTGCTLSGNIGTGGAGGTSGGNVGAAVGGLANSAGTSTVRNTISAVNSFSAGNSTSAADAFGAFASQGWNLIGKSNGSTGFTATGDQTGTNAAPLDARFGLFQNNGGPTDTFLLLAGSPASDKGRAFSLRTDQRNLPRLYDTPGTPNASGGDGTDIGAVEMQPDYNGPLKILSLTRVGPTARVVIQGTNSVSYQLQKTDVLTNTLGTSFVNFGAQQITDSIGQTEFTDFGPLPAKRFYRAGQVP